MVQAFRYPSATNYHPVATNLVVGYIRDPSRFPLTRYIQYKEVKDPTFFYFKLDRDEMVRMRNLEDHLWADGAERFKKSDIQFGFREQQAFCNRYSFDTIIGNIALNRHDDQWGAKKVYLKGLAAKAMLARTLNVWQGGPGGGAEGTTTAWLGLDNPATWPSTNVANANDLNGNAGTWDKAGSDQANPGNFLAIRKSIEAATTQIFLQTNGNVRADQLNLIVSPNLARYMANSDEIKSQLFYSPYAKENLRGNKADYNERFGLPDNYAGVNIIVEDTMFVRDLPTAGQTTGSTNRQFVKADNIAVLTSRDGAIDAPSGPSFSTVQIAWYARQLAAQTFVEPRDEVTQMSVVDFYAVIGPALESGFCITGVL